MCPLSSGMEVSFEWAICLWEIENKVGSQVRGIFTLGQGCLVKWVTEVKDFLQLFLPQILHLLKHEQAPSEPSTRQKIVVD